MLPWRQLLRHEPFVIYVHYPYCASLCSYCNFNKYLDKDTVDHGRMQHVYLAELDRALDLVDGALERPVLSLYFGGGTPSLAPPALISSLVDAVHRRCRTTPSFEVTLEANPTSAERNRLRDYRAAGVTRLSLGVQSLRDDALQRLGRQHTANDARVAWEMARELFPDRSSLDLIWGRPGQTASDWLVELQEALAIARGHLSLYHLALERGTKLERQHRVKPSDFPATDLIEDMFELTVQATAAAGYKQYEASSFALPGHESVHNSAYWRGIDYIGLGPGAHGRFFSASNTDQLHGIRQRRIQILHPDQWQSDVEAGQTGTKLTHELSPQELCEEMIMLGMQLREGVDARRFERYTGQALSECLNLDGARQLLADGFIELDAHGVRPTARGMFVVDSLLPRLLPSSQRSRLADTTSRS